MGVDINLLAVHKRRLKGVDQPKAEQVKSEHNLGRTYPDILEYSGNIVVEALRGVQL